MAITPEILERTTRFEGSIPHLYLDTTDNVTIGVGHLVASEAAAGALSLVHKDGGTPATEAEKRADWTAVSEAEPGRAAHYYDQFTHLKLTDPGIQSLLRSDLEGTEAELKQRLADYDTYPPSAQAGLIDMAFNLGTAGLFHGFPKFIAAVKARKWQDAADQCHREGISDERNEEVRQLFLDAAAGSDTVGGSPAEEVKEPSGAAWVARFPGSRSLDDLEAGFRQKVRDFIAALDAAGASHGITSTYRPPERAYLMHWSWLIARQHHDASNIPAMAGVNIEWWHGDQASSETAAQDMVNGYGTGGSHVPPALDSRHTHRQAVDMSVSWQGTLTIQQADGSATTIDSLPRSSLNPDLIVVAATYGVIHFLDPPADATHWSIDGH